MSRYQKRLTEDLESLRRRVASVAARVDDAVGMAVHALLTGNRALANETVLNDFPINRISRAIDADCHVFVARHLPSAGHLRFVSSVLRLNIALERIGDYAVTIARETEQLGKPPPSEIVNIIQQMADQSRKMYRQAIEAWVDQNPELARGTKVMASSVDDLHDIAWKELLKLGSSGEGPSLRRLFALLIVFSNLERVSDQAKNICEEAIFAATGETKPAKQYKVLFVDEGNDRASVLAQAIAGKAFPESGSYTSAGWSAAQSHSPETLALLDELGLEPGGAAPTPLAEVLPDLRKQHVIVSLAGNPRPHLGRVPFNTIILEWSVPTDLKEARQHLGEEIGKLMEKLRGEGAR